MVLQGSQKWCQMGKDKEGNSAMLPAVKALVLEVDLERRRITIDPDGLYQPSEDETSR